MNNMNFFCWLGNVTLLDALGELTDSVLLKVNISSLYPNCTNVVVTTGSLSNTSKIEDNRGVKNADWSVTKRNDCGEWQLCPPDHTCHWGKEIQAPKVGMVVVVAIRICPQRFLVGCPGQTKGGVVCWTERRHAAPRFDGSQTQWFCDNSCTATPRTTVYTSRASNTDTFMNVQSFWELGSFS